MEEFLSTWFVLHAECHLAFKVCNRPHVAVVRGADIEDGCVLTIGLRCVCRVDPLIVVISEYRWVEWFILPLSTVIKRWHGLLTQPQHVPVGVINNYVVRTGRSFEVDSLS